MRRLIFYRRPRLTGLGIAIPLCLVGLLLGGSSQAQTAAMDTASVLELNFPDGRLSIKKSKDKKAHWQLSAKSGNEKDSLLVLEAYGKRHQLYVNPQSGERNFPDSSFIQLPQAQSLLIRSGKGGFNLQGLAGKIEGQAQSGSIKGSALKGSVNLYTGEGNLVLKNAHVVGLVGTGQGDVLLENVEGAIEGFSRQGKVTRRFTAAYFKKTTTPFQLQVEQADVEIHALPLGGELAVGKGNIQIKSAEKKLAVVNGQGDIMIESADAGVHALTQKGNLSLSLSQKSLTRADTIELQLKSGRLTLSLPAAFAGVLQVELLDSSVPARYAIENAFAQPLAPLWPYNGPVPAENQPGRSQTTPITDATGKVVGQKTTLYQPVGTGGQLIRLHVEDGSVEIKKNLN